MPYRNVLILSLSESASPESKADRRRAIMQVQPPVKRLASLALHGFAISFPRTTSRIIDGSYNPNIEYVGAGADAVVYRTRGEDMVTKVRKDSLSLDASGKETLRDHLRAEHEPVAQKLASFVVPQSIETGAHPVSGVPAVIIKQGYREIKDLGLFHPDDAVLQTDAVRSAIDDPALKQQLTAFVAASNELYDEHGLTPDVGGRNNLCVSTDGLSSLVLIDGQPLSEQKNTSRVMTQLDLLGEHL